MASYFDEHNCNELPAGQQPDHWLHMARLLLDSGLAADMDIEFGQLFGTETIPGASKRFLNEMPDAVDSDIVDEKCAICLSEMKIPAGDATQVAKKLPCKHVFHKKCIHVWLVRVAFCPLCKSEVPTDDVNYEEYKRQKKRNAERDEMLKDLHNNMFG